MQMWDEGQAYDDAECVLQRLTADAAAAAAEAEDKALIEKESRSAGEPSEKQAEITIPTTTKIALSSSVAPFDDVVVVVAPRIQAFPAIAVDDSVAGMQASPPSSQQAKSEALLATLPVRLELAASHADKDITESLSALCSWAALVTTTATSAASSDAPSQISREASIAAFFRSRALEMLFQQIFSHPDRLMHQLPAVQTGLSSLLRHLLRPVSMKAGGNRDEDKDSALDGLLRGLEGALAQLKDIHELKGTIMSSATVTLGESTVTLLVQRVCTAVRSAYHHSIALPSSLSLSSSSHNQQQQDLSSATAVRSPVEVLREIDGQLCQVSTAMAHSQQSAGGNGNGSGELQRSLVLREMASDKLTLLLQARKQTNEQLNNSPYLRTNMNQSHHIMSHHIISQHIMFLSITSTFDSFFLRISTYRFHHSR